MGLRGHHFLGSVATVLALFAARTADAESARYSAPPECPPPAWFEAELSARLHGRESTASLWVDIRAAEGGFVGRVEWRDPALAAVTREVRHGSCEQVARALALIGAVLIETSAAPPAKPPESVPLPAAPAIAPAPPAERPIGPLPRRAWTWHTGPSMSLGVMSAVAPILLAGPRPGWELSAEHPRGERGYIVGLSLGSLGTGQRPYELGQAALGWYAVRLEACALWRVTGRVGVAPCLMMDAGELRGEGYGTLQTFRQKSLWLSPGLTGRGELRLIGPLAFRIEMGGFFPLYTPTFYFVRPDDTHAPVYRVKAVGLTMEAGLVARLP